MTAFKGQSFKVGWGRDMTLLCLGTNKTVRDYDDSNSDLVINYFLPVSARYITINKITNINDNVFKVSTFYYQNKYQTEYCEIIGLLRETLNLSVKKFQR